MYCINIVLYGYSQLKILDELLIKDLEQKFNDIAEVNGGICHLKHPYRLFLPLHYVESARIAIECASSLRSVIQECRNNHIGSSIIVTREDLQESSELEYHLNYLLNFITVDDSIWLDKRSLSTLNSCVSYRDMGKLALVCTLNSSTGLVHQNVQQGRLFRSLIGSHLKKYGYGVSPRKLLLFYGESGMGKCYTIDQVVSSITHEEAFSFPVIDSYLQKYDILKSFEDLFCFAVLEQMPQDIEPEEQLIFEQLRGFYLYLKTRQSVESLDRINVDLILFAQFYFRSYKKYCYRHQLPQWVFLYYTNNFHAFGRQILEYLLEIMYHNGLMVIAVDHQLIDFKYYDVEAYKIHETFYYENGKTHQQQLQRTTSLKPYEAVLVEWLTARSVVFHESELNRLEHLVFTHLDALSKQIIFQAILADGMLVTSFFVNSLQLDKQGQLLAYKRLVWLEKLRLIVNAKTAPRISISHIRKYFYDNMAKEIYSHFRTFSRYLLNENYLQETSLWHLYIILEKSLFINEALNVLHRYLHALLDTRRIEIQYYLSYNYFEGIDLTHEQQSNIRVILFSVKQRARELNYRFLGEDFVVDDMSYVEVSDNMFVNYYLLQKYRSEAKYMLVKETLIPLLKKLTFSFQKKLEYKGEAFTNYELAYIHFKQGKLRQSIELCEIALRIFVTYKLSYGEVMSLTLRAITTFSHGSLHQAKEFATQASIRALELGSHQHWHVLRFIQTRVDIEFGEYISALSRLKEDLLVAIRYNRESIISVIKNWIFRCYVYLKDFDTAKKSMNELQHNLEFSYFFAEMCMQLSDYNSMVDALSETYNQRRDDAYSISEEFDWTDGYQVLDGQRNYNQRYSILRGLTDEMYLYALAKISYETQEEKQQAVDNLQIICDLHEAQVDYPYNYILPYLYADVVREYDEELFTIAINRSWRTAMTWAGRMFDAHIKNTYISGNFWIKKIQHLKRSGLE